MGYFTKDDLPFTCGMARTFPIADRYFCSAMAQTDPNRRYLIAGTSLGLIDDTFPPTLPPNGVIFEQFDKHGITWKDYYSTLPTLGRLPALPRGGQSRSPGGQPRSTSSTSTPRPGTSRPFSLVEPDYDKSVRRRPPGRPVRRSVHGQGRQRRDVRPQLAHDHVDLDLRRARGLLRPRPAAGGHPPRRRPPDLQPGDPPGGFDRYGFRVPAGVVSPYAKKDFVSHTVYDHTSILKTVEEKWNLPALTRRDANATSLFDMVDLRSKPAFLTPPKLPAAAEPGTEGRMPDHRAGNHPTAVGGHQGLTDDPLAVGCGQRPATRSGVTAHVSSPERVVWARATGPA